MMHFQKLLIFIISWVFLGYTLEYAFDFFLKKNYDFKPSYVASGEINANILVCGPSRVLYGINPHVVESVMDKSCYNMGINASSIKEQYTLLQLYLNHNRKPDILALELHRAYLGKDAMLQFNTGCYASFLNEENIAGIIEKEDPALYSLSKFPFLKHSLHGYSVFRDVVKGILQWKAGPTPLDFDKGYQAQQRTWPEGLAVMERPEQVEVDSVLLDYYRKAIELAQSHHIRVILFTAPYYQDPAYQETPVHQLAEAYKIPYWPYTSLIMSQKKHFFYDATHLNEKGAIVFSEILARDLHEFIERS